MRQGLISDIAVVVPILNEAKYLPAFFESWLAQTWLPQEMIVVDGGSDQETLIILEKYQEKARVLGVRWVKIEQKTLGIILARDTGIRLATAKYVYMADVDTIYGKKNLEWASQWLTRGFVGVTGYAKADKPIWFLKVINWGYRAHSQLTFKLFKTVWGLRGYHNVFDRSVYLRSPGMKVNCPAVEDELGLTRLLNKYGKIAYEPKMEAVTSSRRAEQGLGKFLAFLVKDYWGSYWLARLGMPARYRRSLD